MVTFLYFLRFFLGGPKKWKSEFWKNYELSLRFILVELFIRTNYSDVFKPQNRKQKISSLYFRGRSEILYADLQEAGWGGMGEG